MKELKISKYLEEILNQLASVEIFEIKQTDLPSRKEKSGSDEKDFPRA
jgi:hypothetical protein